MESVFSHGRAHPDRQGRVLESLSIDRSQLSNDLWTVGRHGGADSIKIGKAITRKLAERLGKTLLGVVYCSTGTDSRGEFLKVGYSFLGSAHPRRPAFTLAALDSGFTFSALDIAHFRYGGISQGDHLGRGKEGDSEIKRIEAASWVENCRAVEVVVQDQLAEAHRDIASREAGNEVRLYYRDDAELASLVVEYKSLVHAEILR